MLFAYFTNRRFVFESASRGRDMLREMWQFVSARVLSYLLFDLLFFNVFLFFMNDRPAKLIMNGFVILFNYLASRFVVFKKPKAKRKTGQPQQPEDSLPVDPSEGNP